MLYMKDAGMESTDQHFLSMFFTLSRFNLEQEHGKTGERGMGPPPAPDFSVSGSERTILLLALCLLSPWFLRLCGQCWTPLAKVLPQVDFPNPGKYFPAIYQHGNG